MAMSVVNTDIKKCHIPNHSENVLNMLQAHFEEQLLSDVVLTAGLDKKSYSAHRLLLSASSPYFKSMFTGSMVESTQQEIVIQGIYGDDLEALIHYCYTGYIEIRKATVDSLLDAACLLQLDAVIPICIEILQSQLDVFNCLGISLFAEQHCFHDLQNRAQAYICKNFVQICKSAEFFELSAVQFGKIIASDDIHISTEQHIFNIVMSWIYHDRPNRMHHLSELLPLVRLTLLKPSFIAEHVVPVCDTHPKCMKLAMDAIQWHLVPEKRTVAAQPPRKFDGILMVACYVYGERGMQVGRYCPDTNEWLYSIRKISYNQTPDSIDILTENLIMLRFHGFLQTVDLTTNVIKEVPVPSELFDYGIAYLDEDIYFVGGIKNGKTVNTVQRYNLLDSSATFSDVGPLKYERHSPGVVFLGLHMYVIGGLCTSRSPRTLRSVERYDVETDKWISRAPMNMSRYQFGVASDNGFLYVVGGYSGYTLTRTVERYDPKMDKWTTICSLNREMGGISCGVLGDSLMVIGYTSSSNYVEEYDLFNNKWTKKASIVENSDVGVFKVVSQFLWTTC